MQLGGCPRWCEEANSPLCLAFGTEQQQQLWGWHLVQPMDKQLYAVPQQEPHQLQRSAEQLMFCLSETVSLSLLQVYYSNLIDGLHGPILSCFPFKRVLIMGNNFTYNSTDFGKDDVYNTIRTYLSTGKYNFWALSCTMDAYCICSIWKGFQFPSTGSGARCYNASDPELNSTAWFVNNIGSFVTFMTLDDLTSFVSTSQVRTTFLNLISDFTRTNS